MRPLFASLLLLLIAAIVAAPAHATSHCEFVLGFKTLRDLIGHDIVGECLEDQRYAANGNSEQQTTGGLLVWRKADNWTAFTDGHRTWINGPNGLEQRLKKERFAWEPDYAPGGSIATPPPRPTAPPPTPPPRPTIDPILAHAYHVMRRTQAGSDIADKFVRLGASATFGNIIGPNALTTRIPAYWGPPLSSIYGGSTPAAWAHSPPRIVVNGKFRHESPETIGLILIWPTILLAAHYEVGEIETWEQCMTLAAVAKAGEINYWLQTYGKNGKPNLDLLSRSSSQEEWANVWLSLYLALGSEDYEILKWLWMSPWAREICEHFGEPEQRIDRELADAYRTAMLVRRGLGYGFGSGSEIGSAAVHTTIDAGTDVIFGPLPATVSGRFSPSRNRITINDSLRGYDSLRGDGKGTNEVLAAILIHETYHVQEYLRRGNRPAETEAACLEEEIGAFRLQAQWWYERYGQFGKRNPRTPMERHLNELMQAWRSQGLREWVLLNDYQRQCLRGVVN
ncbi:MAG: hypothetical protein OXE05_00760 [Chloroflexi bacterium]|nr:hypothetical protein [Chloroflexota bacterium]